MAGPAATARGKTFLSAVTKGRAGTNFSAATVGRISTLSAEV